MNKSHRQILLKTPIDQYNLIILTDYDLVYMCIDHTNKTLLSIIENYNHQLLNNDNTIMRLIKSKQHFITPLEYRIFVRAIVIDLYKNILHEKCEDKRQLRIKNLNTIIDACQYDIRLGLNIKSCCIS